jgi:septal ring factor EnvC (AmiA/AmiB activator)
VSAFQQQARDADAALERVQAETAALAASVQQSEAAITMAEAELALVQGQRGMLEGELAQRREPIVRLTGALQRLVRRPLSLSLLRPGSLKETVYLGAVLDTAIPAVRERTAALRSDLDRARKLERDASNLIGVRRETSAELDQVRAKLAAQSEKQRRASRSANSSAQREATRALAMAEEARDLDGLTRQLEASGGRRAQLALLPGPVMRPADISGADIAGGAGAPSPEDIAQRRATLESGRTPPPAPFRLPVDGRITAGFGESDRGGTPSSGLTLATRAAAQVIAPAKGRIAFAGPYRGYDNIIILEHEGGWTSLVTGLGSVSAQVGDRVMAGSPLGTAAEAERARAPSVTLELRRGGKPVNPLEFLSR